MLLVFGLVGEQAQRTPKWNRSFLFTRCIDAAVHRPITSIDCDEQVWVSNCIGCGDESNLTVVAVRSLRARLGTRIVPRIHGGYSSWAGTCRD